MLDVNKIYISDCLKFLSKIDDQSIDLAIIDPPYFLNKADWDSFKSFEDFMEFTNKWIDALIPKLKPTASFYVFNTPFNSAFILMHCLERQLKFRNWLTWDKRDGFSASRKKYQIGQETILFFTVSDQYTFNSENIRVPYESTERIAHAEKKGILKNGKRWFPNPKGRMVGDVWHISSERHKNKINGKTPKLAHLTPKPLEMIDRMIMASSNKGDLVVDFFVGSGTTAVSAKKLGRNFICADKSPKYVKIARDRLKQLP